MELDALSTAFLVCFAVGGATLIFQLLLGLAGRAEVGDDATWLTQPRTLRSVAALLAFFGLSGLATLPLQGPDLALMVACLGAGLAFFLVRWFTDAPAGFAPDAEARLDRAVGQTATVFVLVPGQRTGAGRVLLNLHNHPLECQAKTDHQQLPAGTRVRIAGVLGHDTLLVAPVPKPADTPNPRS